MASFSGWGRSTWGNAAWGSSGTLEVTGVEAAGVVPAGWGRSTWGSGVWGSTTVGVSITVTLSVTGFEATGSTGLIIFQDDLITGWGRSTWGSSVWGDPAVVIETGVEAASAIGTPTFIHGAGVEVTRVEAASAIGTVGFGVEFDVTGVGAIGSISTPNVWSEIGTSSGTIWIDIAA